MRIHLSNKYAASDIDRIIPIYHSDGTVTLDINVIRDPVIELEPYECLALQYDKKWYQTKININIKPTPFKGRLLVLWFRRPSGKSLKKLNIWKIFLEYNYYFFTLKRNQGKI